MSRQNDSLIFPLKHVLLISCIASVVAIACAIFAFHLIAGCVFFVAAVVAVCYETQLELKAKKNEKGAVGQDDQADQ